MKKTLPMLSKAAFGIQILLHPRCSNEGVTISGALFHGADGIVIMDDLVTYLLPRFVGSACIRCKVDWWKRIVRRISNWAMLFAKVRVMRGWSTDQEEKFKFDEDVSEMISQGFEYEENIEERRSVLELGYAPEIIVIISSRFCRTFGDKVAAKLLLSQPMRRWYWVCLTVVTRTLWNIYRLTIRVGIHPANQMKSM